MGFHELVCDAFGSLRVALQDLLGALPEQPARAVDVERVLSVDKRLAWQVFTLANSDDLRLASQVPARSSVTRLVEAAQRQSVPTDILSNLTARYEQFEKFTIDHAGDRQSLLSMINAQSMEPDWGFEMRVRESLFRAHSHVFGTRMAGLHTTGVVVPSTRVPGGFDEIVVNTIQGIERLRETDQPVHRFWTRRTHGGGSNITPVDGSMPSIEVLEQFTAPPMPLTTSKPNKYGGLETSFRIATVGKTGLCNLCTAHTIHDSGAEASRSFESNTLNTTPIESMWIDLIIPAGWADPRTVRVACYANRFEPREAYSKNPSDLFPIGAQAMALGRGVRSFTAAPKHREAILYILKRHGLDERDMENFHAAVRYPMLHAQVSLTVDRLQPSP